MDITNLQQFNKCFINIYIRIYISVIQHLLCYCKLIIHGLGSNVVDYVIFDIPLYNEIINFDILNDHEPNSYHRTLIVTLNIFMHRDPIDDNPHSQKT